MVETYKGIIKIENVENPFKGMKVIRDNKVFTFVEKNEGTNWYSIIREYVSDEGKESYRTNALLNSLWVFKIEAEIETGKIEGFASIVSTKQVLLESSQYQYVLDNNLIDEEVEFELIHDLAKIIIKEKKIYTEEDLLDLTHWIKTTSFNIEGHDSKKCLEMYFRHKDEESV